MSKRRKKYNPHKARDAFIRKYQYEAWTIDGSMMPHLEIGGVPQNHPFFKDFIAAISTRVLPWRIWMCAFHLDREGKPFIKSEIHEDLGPAVADSLADELGRRLQKLIDSCNKNLLISHGWFATADKTLDIPAMEEDLVQLFADKGAFDRDESQAVYQARKEAEATYGDA